MSRSPRAYSTGNQRLDNQGWILSSLRVQLLSQEQIFRQKAPNTEEEVEKYVSLKWSDREYKGGASQSRTCLQSLRVKNLPSDVRRPAG